MTNLKNKLSNLKLIIINKVSILSNLKLKNICESLNQLFGILDVLFALQSNKDCLHQATSLTLGGPDFFADVDSVQILPDFFVLMAVTSARYF